MKQTINIGAAANDGTGDQLRTAFDKANDNFDELYSAVGGIVSVDNDTTMAGDSTAVPPSQHAVIVYIAAQIAAVIASAPGALNTLDELAAALGDDSNFAATITAALAGKVPLAGGTMTGDLQVPAEAYGGSWNGSAEVPTKNDVYDKIEAVVAGVGSYTDEQAQDAVGAILVDSSTIDFTYNDATPSITATVNSSAVKPTESIIIALGDETTAITTGTAKVTLRMPYAFTLTAVRASLTTMSSSGLPTFDINEGGVSILSTKLTIDASEKTSTTAGTPAVISDAALADDAEITIDIDVAGTGAAGAKIYLIGNRT